MASLRELTIFIMSFISSFDIVSIVPEPKAPDPKIFLCWYWWFFYGYADAAAVNLFASTYSWPTLLLHSSLLAKSLPLMVE